ncbi:site-2 protease family protein [Thermoproteota archaeon]
MNTPMILISIFVLIYSVVLHEVAHAKTALIFGDDTAQKLGRITFNPIPHLDIVGSILIPGFLIMIGSPFLMGWAKPVLIRPENFKNPTKDMMWVSISGPLTNISIAIIASIVLKIVFLFNPTATIFWRYAVFALVSFVQINIVLAVFNLIPIPPLDGSGLLEYFLPPRYKLIYSRIEPYGMLILLGLIYFGIIGMLLELVLTPVLGFLIG